MIKKWNRKQTYLTVAILVAVLIIYGISYFSIIKPMQAEKDALDNEVSMYEKQLERITNQSTDELDEDLLKVADLVPNHPTPDNLLVNLKEIASSTNVNIDYIANIGTTTDGNDDESSTEIKENSYTVDITGNTLADINDFMDQIITNERLIRIDTMNVNQETDVFLTLTLTVFYTV